MDSWFSKVASHDVVLQRREVSPRSVSGSRNSSRGPTESLPSPRQFNASQPSNTVTVDDVKIVWATVCRIAEHVMFERGASIIVPNLFHLLSQEQLSHSGTWHVRHCFIPHIILAPNLISACNVQDPIAVSHAQRGSRPAVILGPVQIHESLPAETAARIPRHVVGDIMKAFVNTLTTALLENGSFVVTLVGIGRIELARGQKARIHWDSAFLQRFDEANGVEPSNAAAVARMRTQLGSSPRRIFPASSSSQCSSRQSSTSPRKVLQPPQKMLPKPPSAPATPTKLPTSLSLPDVLMPARHENAAEEQSTTTPQQQKRPIPPPPGQPPQVTQDTASPWYRHKLHKLAVRREREKADVESWASQLAEHEARRLQQTLESREIQAACVEARLKNEKEAAEARQKARETAESVKLANMDAAKVHNAFVLPLYVPMGSLSQPTAPGKESATAAAFVANRPTSDFKFSSRCTTARAGSHDMAELDFQVAARTARQTSERESDRELGRRLHEDAALFHQQTRAAKDDRRAKSEKCSQFNEAIAVQSKKTLAEQLAARRDEGTLKTSLMYDSLENVERRRDRANKLRDSQRNFLREHEVHKQSNRTTLSEQTRAEAADVDRFMEKTCLLHSYEKTATALRHMENREAWNEQIRLRGQAEQEAKARDDAFRHVALYRNDSSDDES